MSDPQKPTTPSQQARQTDALDMDHQRRAFATQQADPQSAGLNGAETTPAASGPHSARSSRAGARSTSAIRRDLADLQELVLNDRHGPNTLSMLVTLVLELASAVDDCYARIQRLEDQQP